MKQDFPTAYAAFERMLGKEGYASVGHMFGQLSKAAEPLGIFIAECGSTPPIEFKNIEEIKQVLATAFEKGEAFQKWKITMKEKYPSAFSSFVTMCKHNGYATIERALASLQQIATLLVIWLGNCNVVMSEDSIAEGDMLSAMERAFRQSEELSQDLAL